MRRHQVDHQEAEDWISDVWPHYATWNDDFMEFWNNEWSIE
jgi:hypothetical protein